MRPSKILIYVALIAVLLFQCHITEAVRNQESQTTMNKILAAIDGDWYNNAGNRILSIHNGYFNGCKVLAAFDFAGSFASGGTVLRIQEQAGLRDLRIGWHQGEGTEEYLQFNNGEHLHRAPANYFFESIGGIHLGMTLDEVKAKYGTAQVIPPGRKFIDGDPNRTRWYYPKLGIVLWLDGQSICRISLLKGSKLHFDRSGLSCQNTPKEFARAYSMDRIPELPEKGRDSYAYGIGHGEYLYFGHDMSYVGLDMYGF